MPLIVNRVSKIKVDNELILDLGNIDLINSLFSYNRNIERFNDDVEKVENFQEMINDLYSNNKIEKENYISLIKQLAESYRDLKKFLNNFDKETMNIIATAKARADKDKSILIKLSSLFIKKHHEKSFKVNFNKHLKQIEEDRKNVRDKSKNKLEAIFRN